MKKKNINDFLFYLKKKKKNFVESIDLNIKIFNKNKKYFNEKIEIIYSKNECKNILLLSSEKKINNNIFIGNNFFYEYLENKISFFKIFSDKENEYLIIKNIKNIKKNLINNYLINNYNSLINSYNNKNIDIIINKNNMLNLTIANTNFKDFMIIKNYEKIINDLKKKIFLNKNIIIEYIYISSTMSKSFLLK